MKNIFLSASIPISEEHPQYHSSADVIAIRDAVIALAYLLLPQHRVIWGGHPSITPLIYYVIEKLVVQSLKRDDWDLPLSKDEIDFVNKERKFRIQNHVRLYQSLFYKDDFPKQNEEFENIVYTEDIGNGLASTNLMRNRMLSENDFAAAVFIGGMDGIEIEYEMFRALHPQALLLPLASTGGAAKLVYQNRLPEKFKNERLLKDYGYLSLFQKLLVEKL